MDTEIRLQIILIKPTSGVDFGLQKGTGNNYQTIQKQQASSGNLNFDFAIKIKGDPTKDESPRFSGEFVQGPPGGKFVYLDIGTAAGQTGSPWSRRLKIPLTGISWKDIESLANLPASFLTTSVPGTGKDGSPNCATVKPFSGWQLTNA
jgi:hypothetical protein